MAVVCDQEIRVKHDYLNVSFNFHGLIGWNSRNSKFSFGEKKKVDHIQPAKKAGQGNFSLSALLLNQISFSRDF